MSEEPITTNTDDDVEGHVRRDVAGRRYGPSDSWDEVGRKGRKAAGLNDDDEDDVDGHSIRGAERMIAPEDALGEIGRKGRKV